MLPIKPMLTDFMSDDEKAVVFEYETRSKFRDSLKSTLSQLTKVAGRLPHDRKLPFMREGIAIFLKSERIAPAEFTESEINVKIEESNISTHFSFSTENPEIKSYLEIPTELSERYAQAMKAAEERYRTHVYPRTGILKNDYPCSVPGLTADQARINGWVPEGYELVPVKELDILAAPTFNNYVYEEDPEYLDAANLVEDILLERAKLLGGS